MSVEPWQFERHLFTRSDVVVIFIDMDPSLNEEDLALPIPLGAPCPVSPPRTRYEIVRAALRSFWTQKERSATNLNRLSIAVYGVWDDVVELMPVTLSSHGAQHIDDALYEHLGGTNPHYEGSSPPPSTTKASHTRGSTDATSFPFHAVGEVLKSIKAQEVIKAQARTTSAAADVFTVVQGVLLLSRPSAPPVNVAPPNTDKDARAECLLDVVCLCQLSQPSSAYDVVASQHKGGRAGVSPTKTGSSANGSRTNAATASAVSHDATRTSTDIPCTVIDPVAFTGITHKGLAVGPSLTKLLCLHQAHAKAFLETPLTVIDIPVSTEMPSPRSTNGTAGKASSSPSKGASRKSSAAAAEPLDTAGGDFARLRPVATTNSLAEAAVLSDSPAQGSLYNSSSASAAGSPRREPLSGRQRDAQLPTSFVDIGRQRSTASVTFGVTDKASSQDDDFTLVKHAETSTVNGSATKASATTPHREPRPPLSGEATVAPPRFVPHKSAPPLNSSAARKSVAPRPSTHSLSSSASEPNPAHSTSSVGPSPPAGPRLHPQARVNSLTGDAGAGPADGGTKSGGTLSGRLPPRPLAGSARASATTTLNQRLCKDI